MITQNKDGSWNNGSCFGPTKTIKILKRENDILHGESIEILKQRLGFLSKEEENNLITSSTNILEKCVDSSFSNISKEDNTGLVIGKIQSGKTLSFTALIALARDNGYRIVIVISGRTNMLLGQTNKRLIEDLVSKDRNISIERNASDPKQKSVSIKAITRKLKSKNDKLIILPVLKHQGRLLTLKKIFKNQTIKDLLSMKSVLIIDDEADQASLNTEARNNAKYGLSNKSAIYSSIINLRYELPNHSFIQYTATPQGPLLINSLELLSPDWHVLLTPGRKYTGGNDFFNGEYDIVKSIKIEGNYPPEIDNLTSPPESLVSSIIEFMILAVLMGDSIKDKKIYNNRATMLIHPTWRVAETDEAKSIESFYDWTENILEMYEEELEDGEFSMFEKEYRIIKERLEPKNIFKKFPSFENVIIAIKENAFDDIKVHKVVGGMLEKGEEFPWDSCSFHILVGGQLLDRGFTVENLIMTYMPRDSKGSNQSDTIEQRCRFYGYRGDYLPFCRVYLNKNLINDYQSYNEFENELGDYLSKHSLDEFYKNGSRILMNKGLIPTNMSRISDKIISSHMKGSQYFHPQFPYLDENNSLISLFIENIKNHNQYILKPKKKEDQKKNVTHRVTKIPIDKIIEMLIHFETNNMFEKLKLKDILRYIDKLKDKSEECWIIEIAYEKETPRTRTVIKTEEPTNGTNQFTMQALFAGDTKFDTGEIYFGDTGLLRKTNNISSNDFDYNDELIIQIHKIKAAQKTEAKEIKNKIFSTLGFFFPENFQLRYMSKLKNEI